MRRSVCFRNLPSAKEKTGFTPEEEIKAQEGFSDIALGILLGAEIAHGRINRDFTDDDLFYLNNILTKRGFIPVKNHIVKSFGYVARLLFDLLTKKVTN